MARLYPLFSSSKGNSIYIGSSAEGILVDVGVSYKRLLSALAVCGLSISGIKAVFITHDHSDHIKGLYMLTKMNPDIAVYAQEETLRRLIDLGAVAPGTELHALTGNADVYGITASCFETPHDTATSCGYRFTLPDGSTCAVCTDLGHISKCVEEGLRGCGTVLLEANYDDQMLRSGAYPPYVKSRIRSMNGHLSNMDCGRHSVNLLHSGTTRIILGHISPENNTPSLAEKVVVECLAGFERDKDYILRIAPIETTGEFVVI